MHFSDFSDLFDNSFCFYIPAGRSSGINHILVATQEWFCSLLKGGSLSSLTTIVEQSGKVALHGMSLVLQTRTYMVAASVPLCHCSLGHNAPESSLYLVHLMPSTSGLLAAEAQNACNPLNIHSQMLAH